MRLLDQLCTAGLVVRKEDPTDRRAKILSLTQAGRQTVAQMEAELNELREQVFADVDTADLEASVRAFRALQKYIRELPNGMAREEAAE